MSETDRRQKMISLRLSEVEYLDLKTQYRAYGVRNISELARLALQRIKGEPAKPQNGLAEKLAELDERLRQVESQISHLAEREKIAS